MQYALKLAIKRKNLDLFKITFSLSISFELIFFCYFSDQKVEMGMFFFIPFINICILNLFLSKQLTINKCTLIDCTNTEIFYVESIYIDAGITSELGECDTYP